MLCADFRLFLSLTSIFLVFFVDSWAIEEGLMIKIGGRDHSYRMQRIRRRII